MTENETEQLENTNIKVRVEALLFVASGPVTSAQVAEALQVDVKEVEQTLTELQSDYELNRVSLCSGTVGEYS